ncbi:unnamed protein product, partial [Didymodactylos carnosus]
YPFRLFIYPLPSIFNSQIIPYFQIPVHDRSGTWHTGPNITTPSIFNPDANMAQFTSEIALHWQFEKHPCRTLDPEQATFFFLPAYGFYLTWFSDITNMTQPLFKVAASKLNAVLRDSAEIENFFDYVDQQALLDKNSSNQEHPLPSTYKKYLYRHNLCDHLFVASRPFQQWDSSYVWNALDGLAQNLIWLAIEMTPRYSSSVSSKILKNIPIPYLVTGDLHIAGTVIYRQLQQKLLVMNISSTIVEPCTNVFCSIAFADQYQNEYGSLSRPFLTYFAGSVRQNRRHLKELMKQMNNSSLFHEISSTSRNANSQLFRKYLQSTFCFILLGDSASSKRLFDVIAANCIPVIISDQWELPFTSNLPWQQFSIRFSESMLEHNKSYIHRLLTTMPETQIFNMQLNLYKVRTHFLYSLENENFVSQPNDAVDEIFKQLAMRQQYAKTCKYHM